MRLQGCRVQRSNRLGGPLLGVSHQCDEVHPGVKQAYRVGYWGRKMKVAKCTCQGVIRKQPWSVFFGAEC